MKNRLYHIYCWSPTKQQRDSYALPFLPCLHFLISSINTNGQPLGTLKLKPLQFNFFDIIKGKLFVQSASSKGNSSLCCIFFTLMVEYFFLKIDQKCKRAPSTYMIFLKELV